MNKNNFFGLDPPIPLRQYGGSGVKKTCQAYFVEFIAVVSTPFMECQNSTWFLRYDQFNFWGSWLLYRQKRGNSRWFFTILPIKSLILMLTTPKLLQRCWSWIELQKILKMKIVENFGQNWVNFDKKYNFLLKYNLFKITFCVIP